VTEKKVCFGYEVTVKEGTKGWRVRGKLEGAETLVSRNGSEGKKKRRHAQRVISLAEMMGLHEGEELQTGSTGT